jgi:hypothetical protein
VVRVDIIWSFLERLHIMEASIARSLNDKLYDKRKVGALEYVHPHLAVV